MGTFQRKRWAGKGAVRRTEVTIKIAWIGWENEMLYIVCGRWESESSTDVRYTAELYPHTWFSVSFFSKWSQKLLISPPNSSSVVSLKWKGSGHYVTTRSLDHRWGAQWHHVSGSWLMSVNLVSFRMILIRSSDSAWRIRSNWTC